MRWTLCLWLVGLLGAGCRSPTPPEAPRPRAAGAPVLDDLGRAVPRPGPGARVLSLAPGNTELLFALGLGAQVVGRTDACDAPPAAARVPSVGSLFPPDLERVWATRPQAVLMIEGHTALREGLVARGVPVFVLQPRTVAGALESFARVGRWLDAEPAAQRLVARLTRELAAVTAGLPAQRPRVFYVVWPDPLTTPGPRTFLADVIRQAGGQLAAPTLAEDWPRFPLEQLAAADPDVLLVPSSAVAQGPGFRGLRAVRTGHAVVVPDADLLTRTGPRLVAGVAWLAGALHPRATR